MYKYSYIHYANTFPPISSSASSHIVSTYKNKSNIFGIISKSFVKTSSFNIHRQMSVILRILLHRWPKYSLWSYWNVHLSGTFALGGFLVCDKRRAHDNIDALPARAAASSVFNLLVISGARARQGAVAWSDVSAQKRLADVVLDRAGDRRGEFSQRGKRAAPVLLQVMVIVIGMQVPGSVQ